ncbi:MAG: RdgB/HAM1 family non-canonical purine NTP pyrophosphatase [Chloroflexota bacterium]
MGIRLLLASSNQHKLRELRSLLAPHGIELVSPADLRLELAVEETGSTYEENARIKAEAFRDASGLICLADDSGLEVDALNGRPGLFSARFGGAGLDDAGRTALVLEQMGGVPAARRGARFVTVIAIAAPGGVTRTFEGTVNGSITTEPEGDEGFGYDPIFFHAPSGCTLAQLALERKDEVSHRGRAMVKAAEYLRVLDPHPY